jgi:hypothetical protein
MAHDGLMWVEQGGSLLQGSALQTAIEQVALKPIQRGLLRVQAAVQEGSPVLTGNLRRGWYTSEPAWEGWVLVGRVGNPVVYTARVNRTSKKNAGFIEQAVEQSREAAVDEIMTGLQAVKDVIWESRKG